MRPAVLIRLMPEPEIGLTGDVFLRTRLPILVSFLYRSCHLRIPVRIIFQQARQLA